MGGRSRCRTIWKRFSEEAGARAGGSQAVDMKTDLRVRMGVWFSESGELLRRSHGGSAAFVVRINSLVLRLAPPLRTGRGEHFR